MKEELHENEENKRTAWQRKGGKNMENIIMKNRPFKRILSVVLAVLMVITLPLFEDIVILLLLPGSMNDSLCQPLYPELLVAENPPLV